MNPIFIQRSVAEQFADWYVDSMDELGAQSVKELAAQAEISEATVRHGLRIADSRLAAQGKTLTVAEGRNAWRVEPTESERAFAVSARGRLAAIASEVTRYKAKGEATAVRDEQVSRAFSDAEIALGMAVEAFDSLAE